MAGPATTPSQAGPATIPTPSSVVPATIRSICWRLTEATHPRLQRRRFRCRYRQQLRCHGRYRGDAGPDRPQWLGYHRGELCRPCGYRGARRPTPWSPSGTPAWQTIGTIQINGVTSGNDHSPRFPAGGGQPVLPGATAGNNTLNGTAGNDIINALAGNDTVNGGAGNDTITGGLNGTGGPGADILNGDAGDDTFIWNANPADPTDGRDIVNGGTEGGVGDTFVLNGRAGARPIPSIPVQLGMPSVATTGRSLNAATEIVITRNGTNFATVIAELREIEEIRIAGVDPSTGGTIGGDTINIVGDFSGTSLRPNTITIDGEAGDDTIDISSLGSAHRIVFRSNGGNDTIIGNLRPVDVIELPDGATAADYTTTTDANGVSTMTNGTHSVTFTAPSGLPQVGDDEEEDETEDEADAETETSPIIGGQRTGTPVADVLIGNEGDDTIVAFAGDDIVIGDAGADAISAGEGGDFISGGAGRDVIFAGAGDDQVLAGADNDIVYGDAGADRIFGDQGNDLITAGAGDDTVFGGAGDDLIVAEAGDGNDVYFGDEGGGGTGIDTLDMSAATANVTVNLGSGALSNGTASSSQTGNDTIWGIENVNTGSGNDTITASNAVNVMNGGAGDDTFKFTSTTAANGDTIVGFEPGDRIDLTAIDANVGAAGDQSFTLVNGAPTAAGAARSDVRDPRGWRLHRCPGQHRRQRRCRVHDRDRRSSEPDQREPRSLRHTPHGGRQMISLLPVQLSFLSRYRFEPGRITWPVQKS